MGAAIKNSSLRYFSIILIVVLTYIGCIGYMTMYFSYAYERWENKLYEVNTREEELWSYAQSVVFNTRDGRYYAEIDGTYYPLKNMLISLESTNEWEDEDSYVYFEYNERVNGYVNTENMSEIFDPKAMMAGSRKVLALSGISARCFYSNPELDLPSVTEYIYQEKVISASQIGDVQSWIDEQNARIAKDMKENSSYVEELGEFLVKPFGDYAKPVAAICTMLVILLAGFVLVSVGHNSPNKDEITLTGWDRLGYSIHFCVMCCVGGAFWMPFAITGELSNGNETVTIALLCALGISVTVLAFGWFLETTVVRIKAKSFWKTTTIYYIWRWCSLPFERAVTAIKNLILDIKDGRCGLKPVMKATKEIAEGQLPLIDIGAVDEHYKDFAEDINALAVGKTKAVEEMLKSERMRSDLITNVSHDIKTPLTSIISYADLLSKKEVKDEEADEYLEIIQSQSARLKNLLADLIDASKASSGVLPVRMEELAVDVMLTQILSEFDDKFSAKNLAVVTTVPEEMKPIMADGKHLSRVFYNLCANISKYAMVGTRVYVDVSQENGHTTITMKNTSADALNIPAEELIERFARGDAARTREGSGLGLSIADSLMKLMGGRLVLTVDGDLFKAQVIL